MSNAQEIFDTVVTHLRTQGRRAFSDKTGCSYRAEGGLKCAVGCLIPDDAYSYKMEGYMAHELLDKYGDQLSQLRGHGELLRSLQRTHDDSNNWSGGFSSRGEFTLAEVAWSFGLTYTPPAAEVSP